jgi:hypothetical protein
LLVFLVGSQALAASRPKPNIHFFSGEQSDAHWTPKDSADSNNHSVELEVGPEVGTSFAGLELNRVEGTTPPEREPYFYHKEDQAGPSGGSPRLVIRFVSDTGLDRIELRPDGWSTSWQLVGEGDGDGNWDSNGGTCGFQYDVTYAQALACHPGAVIQSVILVTDSNWLYLGGYTNWVDRLQYDGYEFSGPSDNSNSPN